MHTCSMAEPYMDHGSRNKHTGIHVKHRTRKHHPWNALLPQPPNSRCAFDTRVPVCARAVPPASGGDKPPKQRRTHKRHAGQRRAHPGRHWQRAFAQSAHRNNTSATGQPLHATRHCPAEKDSCPVPRNRPNGCNRSASKLRAAAPSLRPLILSRRVI